MAIGGVEKLDDDGETIAVTIFSGDSPRDRARAYAEWRYGSYEEIELQPYGSERWSSR